MSDDGSPTVVQALAAVMGEIPAIGRDNRSEQGYNYRGIEAITQALQPILAKHGVIFVPRVLQRLVKDITINNKPWTEDHLEVEYVVYGPAGDSLVVGPVWGLGRDNSDKGSNKALTQAYKYALIQTLCIGDKKDDPDQATHEADERPVDLTDEQKARKARSDLYGRVKALSEQDRESFKAWLATENMPNVPKDFDDDQLAAAVAWVKIAEDDAKAEAEYQADVTQPVTPSASPDTATAPQQPPPDARSAQPVPDASDSAPDGVDARTRAALAATQNLTPVELLAELGARNAKAPRAAAEQRVVLASLYAADPDWQPA